MDCFIDKVFLNLSLVDLTDDNYYKDFLGNVQNFNTLLIGVRDTQIINSVIDVKEDSEYILEMYRLNDLSDEDIDKYQSYHLSPPSTVDNNSKKTTVHRNPIIGKIALKNSQYLCEYNKLHLTFISGVTGKNYTEAHHLIPIQFQKEYWEAIYKNIDCLENIVSLCPNCHRCVHYGTFDEKNKILNFLFEKKIDNIKNIGINLSKEQLIEMYINSS